MVVSETCPDCGAVRPSWDGGSHFTRAGPKVCADGKSAEQYFTGWMARELRSYSGHP